MVVLSLGRGLCPTFTGLLPAQLAPSHFQLFHVQPKDPFVSWPLTWPHPRCSCGAPPLSVQQPRFCPPSSTPAAPQDCVLVPSGL